MKTEFLKKISAKQKIFQGATILIVVVLSILILLFRDRIENLKDYGYVGLFLVSVLSSASIFLPVPGLFLVITFGAVLNPILVGVISGVGSALGEVTGYFLGYGGRIAVEDGVKYEKMSRWMKKWGGLTILFLAFVPNPLFDAAGIVSGVLKYPLWKFLLFSTAGRIPKHIIFAYAGFYGFYYFL